MLETELNINIRENERPRRVETPAARFGDSASSHEAADEVTRSGQRRANQMVVAATIQMHPGCTSRELTRHCELDRWEIARRTSECETAGTVARGEMRHCEIGNRRALTWWPA